MFLSEWVILFIATSIDWSLWQAAQRAGSGILSFLVKMKYMPTLPVSGYFPLDFSTN